jgi:hypothetical protein
MTAFACAAHVAERRLPGSDVFALSGLHRNDGGLLEPVAGFHPNVLIERARSHQQELCGLGENSRVLLGGFQSLSSFGPPAFIIAAKLSIAGF